MHTATQYSLDGPVGQLHALVLGDDNYEILFAGTQVIFTATTGLAFFFIFLCR